MPMFDVLDLLSKAITDSITSYSAQAEGKKPALLCLHRVSADPLHGFVSITVGIFRHAMVSSVCVAIIRSSSVGTAQTDTLLSDRQERQQYLPGRLT